MTADSTTASLLVRQMRWESDDVVSLRLEHRDGGAVPEWSPGSHVDLHLGRDLVRQYSLCGDPDDKTGYRVAVLHERAGRGGSRHVHEVLRPGYTIDASLPRNNFELLDSPGYLFIAGGIGITPILPMVAEAERRGARWRLYYGGRSRRSMAFVDEVLQYGDRVHLVPQDTDGVLDLPVLLGRAEPDTLVYTCGPEGLLRAVEEQSGAWPDGAVRLERFKPVERTDSGAADKPVRVVCEGSGVAVTVGPETTILDALEGVGVEVPNSCREGMCGSCETRVLCGSPDHRDSVLSSAERESGQSMMLCVSRALTDELVLDI